MAATVVYLVWFRKPEVIIVYIERTKIVEKPDNPIRRLSGFVDAHVDRIFNPLTEKDAVMPSQELRQIRATLRDLSRTANERDRKLYLSGATLCDQLLQAIARRETYARRLVDANAKQPISLEASRERQKDEIQRKWKLFQESILRSWEAEVQLLRVQIGRQYDYMRLLERSVEG